MRHAALALRVLQFKLQPGQPQESQTEHGRRSGLGNRTSEPVRVCENVPVNQVDARRPGNDRTEAGIIPPPQRDSCLARSNRCNWNSTSTRMRDYEHRRKTNSLEKWSRPEALPQPQKRLWACSDHPFTPGT